MANYRIPKSQIPGFLELAQISDNQFEQLISILKGFPVGAGLEDLQASFQENDAKYENSNIPMLVFSFGNLLSNNKGRSFEELSSGLANAYSLDAESELKESSNEIISSRLYEIFNSFTNLKTTFKAYSLISENENVFIDAHIVSDVRIIFDDEITDSNRNAVIIHRLKIECDNDDKSKDFYFALDSNDLVKLNQQIQRAIQKEEIIKTQYSSSIPFINLTE